jgi:predicted dehydrogenase
MSKIRLGIIGAGGRGIFSFGRLFTTQQSPWTQIVAVADPNRARAEAGLKYLGITADVHTDANDMVARKDVDAVVVTTPDCLHEECCLTAFKHGKHVLVDKPLATTAKGCLNIIEAARRAKKTLYMGFNLRHDVVIQNMKVLADAGTFGEIFSMHAIEYYDGGRTYMARWNRLKKFSGGLWIHKGSHDFDVLNWMMGPARPVRVSCFANVSVLNEKGFPFKPRKGVKPGPTCSVCAYKNECPDTVRPEDMAEDVNDKTAATLARMYSEEAARADGYHRDTCIYLSDKDTHDQGIATVEYDNGATASHAEYFSTPISNRRYLIEGKLGHGEADVAGDRIEVTRRWSRDRVVYNLHRPAGGHGGADPVMVSEFVECLRKGKRPSASGIDGAWSVAIGEACEISREEKRMVKISEVLDVKSPLLKA